MGGVWKTLYAASGRSAQHSEHSCCISSSVAPPFCSSVSKTTMMFLPRSMAAAAGPGGEAHGRAWPGEGVGVAGANDPPAVLGPEVALAQEDNEGNGDADRVLEVAQVVEMVHVEPHLDHGHLELELTDDGVCLVLAGAPASAGERRGQGHRPGLTWSGARAWGSRRVIAPYV
eukprot:scaffold13341_cov101-Isochrysis_galbana.AAC.4